MVNTFFRPYAWESKGVLQLISSLEVIAFWLLVLFYFVRGEKKRDLVQPMFLTFLFFGITLYLFIGYTVPFPGAIVRYKTIGELLMILPFLAGIRWQKATQ